jgi:hypothetical protein
VFFGWTGVLGTMAKKKSVFETFELIHNRFKKPEVVEAATEVLHAPEQSEEAFLGAQLVLMLNGAL